MQVVELPFLRLSVMGVFVLFAIGAIVVLWLLLRSPATRWLGVLLLVLPAVLLVVAVLLFFVRSVRMEDRTATVVQIPHGSQVNVGRDGMVDVTLANKSSKQPTSPRLVPTGAASVKHDGGHVRLAAEKVVAEKEETAAKPAAAGTPKRPDWVESKPRSIKGGYQFAVSAGPYESEVECQRELPAKFQEAFDDYVELMKLQFGVQTAERFELPAELRSAAQHDFYRETLHLSVGPMQQLHVQLIFDDRAADWVKQRLRDTAINHRLWCLGGGLAGVLGLLAMMLGYLKIPRQSRGLREDESVAP
jgi:hypothetical protein